MEYRDLLKAQLGKNSLVSDYQRYVAQSIGCDPAFLHKILNFEASLSPEQVLKLCELWDFDDVKSSYFLLLVFRQYAGTTYVRTLIDKLLEQLGMNSDFARGLLLDISGGFDET